MIYCVWYSGDGFGHFVHAILSLNGCNYKRPAEKNKYDNTN